jgi:hypothetical protein
MPSRLGVVQAALKDRTARLTQPAKSIGQACWAVAQVLRLLAVAPYVAGKKNRWPASCRRRRVPLERIGRRWRRGYGFKSMLQQNTSDSKTEWMGHEAFTHEFSWCRVESLEASARGSGTTAIVFPGSEAWGHRAIKQTRDSLLLIKYLTTTKLLKEL